MTKSLLLLSGGERNHQKQLRRQIPQLFGNVCPYLKKLQNAVRGGELKPLAYKLNVTNLLLHGIELPNIRYGDSLAEKSFGDFHGSDLVEYCALNPPYGGVALEEDRRSFPADLKSSETADLFVALSVKRLKTAGVVLSSCLTASCLAMTMPRSLSRSI